MIKFVIRYLLAPRDEPGVKRSPRLQELAASVGEAEEGDVISAVAFLLHPALALVLILSPLPLIV